MSDTTTQDPIHLTFALRLEGVKHGEEPPAAAAYAFDVTGGFIAKAHVEDGRASLALPRKFANQTVRFFFGPAKLRDATPSVSGLIRDNGYEVRQRVDASQSIIDLPIYDPIWRGWLFCECVVTGQLVTTVTLPSGATTQLPICNARVNICQVWDLPIIIRRLPEPILLRLRDAVVDAVTQPLPTPPVPGPVDVGARANLALATAPARAAAAPLMRPPASAIAHVQAESAPALSSTALNLDAQTLSQVRALSQSTAADDIASRLVDLRPLWIDWFCFWEWLEPWLEVDCFETVTTDDNGNFFAIIWYPCGGPTPNLYFSADQLQGSNWVTIYDPWVRCGTYWNYTCGTNVVLNVTDPAAIPCAPPQSVNPPGGADSWVLVTAVGGTFVWGTAPTTSPPIGWLQQDGLTDYGATVDAPFGGYLGFQSGASIDIPRAGAAYYRWSYRPIGTTDWFYMSDPVVRHYVKETPPALPTFPVEIMGPLTVAGQSSLYMFKPLNPPGPAPSDPPGTITYWPTDDLFDDIYSGYLDTTAIPGGAAATAGVYQIKIEVFDDAANPVVPGPTTFTFIVPQNVASDGTVTARAAQASELDADGGFMFNLHIDNNPCTASIDPPAISGGGTVNACGFLNYASASDPIAIDFEADHPNGFATFSFTMVLGATGVPSADVAGGAEVWATSAGPYAGDGAGDFSDTFTVGALLDGCVNAAFAEDLQVTAKATTGWGDQIAAYNAGALRAFALAAS